MNEAVDYAYDVFFSYKRHELTIEWTKKVQGLLDLHLSMEMARQVKIFVDSSTIEVGDHWPNALRNGLRLSRCMVGVWSPLYFQSSWCMSEWNSFRERERSAKMLSHGLIVPVNFHDGENFPEEARQIQSLDLTPYASALPAFWNSSRAVELEDQIKLLAKSIAKILARVPPFDPNWPLIEVAGTVAPNIPLGRL